MKTRRCGAVAGILASGGMSRNETHRLRAAAGILDFGGRSQRGHRRGRISTWLRLVPQPSGGLSASRFFRDQPMLEIKGLTWSHRPEIRMKTRRLGAVAAV
jgi:hypothetical protein